jgi:hypothetical protein
MLQVQNDDPPLRQLLFSVVVTGLLRARRVCIDRQFEPRLIATTLLVFAPSYLLDNERG